MPDPVPDTPPEPTDGRARLLAALRSTSRGQVVVAVLLAAVGFAAVTQVKSNDKDDQYVGARQGDLIQYINNLTLAARRTESEIAQLEENRAALRTDTDARRTAAELARAKADTLGLLAGTVPAVGPGVRITVTDIGQGVGTNQLLNGLQELRDAGAEVIEFNDSVRAVAQTSFQDTASGGVSVDGTTLEAPFVIEAIGDPDTLATALDFYDGFIDGVADVGGQVEVEKRTADDGIKISSVVDPDEPRFSQVSPSR